MSDLVQILMGGGADLEGVANNDRARKTPIVFAADSGVWDGGAISALLKAGADVNAAKDTDGSTGMFLRLKGCFISCSPFGSAPSMGLDQRPSFGLSKFVSDGLSDHCSRHGRHRPA